MASAQQLAREQQAVEELCGAALRALAADPALHFRDRRLHRGDRPVPVHAPHLRVEAGSDGMPCLRALVDGVSLRLRHSDAALHRALAPTDPVERLIFELIEQLRVEVLAPSALPGVQRNLQRRFLTWLRAFHASGLTETRLGVLLFTVSQMCWSRLAGLPVPEEMEGAIEHTRAGIAPVLGGPLAALRRHRHDQRAAGEAALEIARIVAAMVHEARASEDGTEEPVERYRGGFALMLDFDADAGTDVAVPLARRDRGAESPAPGYRVFTTRYDTEVAAEALIPSVLLERYREQLNRLLNRQAVNFWWLVRQFRALFAAPRRDDWSFGTEEGLVDGRRLAQLVCSPADHRIFRRERYVADTDAVVSFLIDCSGSMKTHCETVTVLVDLLVRALDRAGVATEVLGFTTGGWNGGRAWQEWLRAGRPPEPGRLNEIRHLVFKNADRSWRRARPGIAALLKADLYREGIDGEAVAWAARRLLARPEQRRVLVVLSDGCPMDSATALANGEHYLDAHLQSVVAQYERTSEVEILGLGVGLDLSRYYRRSLATDPNRALDHRLFREFMELLRGRHRR
jgi:cobaltochelatase CobT